MANQGGDDVVVGVWHCSLYVPLSEPWKRRACIRNGVLARGKWRFAYTEAMKRFLSHGAGMKPDQDMHTRLSIVVEGPAGGLYRLR